LPIYDYKCSKCENRFTLRQGFDANTISECTKCGGDSTRVIHAPQIVYKADGFYSTEKTRKGFGSYWYDKASEEDRGIPQEQNVADMGTNPTVTEE
tara:strand:+ start:5670 stop:5957 length:288 start_codon:yes stop_codon:yes gene_type:complete